MKSRRTSRLRRTGRGHARSRPLWLRFSSCTRRAVVLAERRKVSLRIRDAHGMRSSRRGALCDGRRMVGQAMLACDGWSIESESPGHASACAGCSCCSRLRPTPGRARRRAWPLPLAPNASPATAARTAHAARSRTSTAWPEQTLREVVKAYRDKRLANAVMQNIAGRLKDDEIEALAAYFATTKRPP